MKVKCELYKNYTDEEINDSITHYEKRASVGKELFVKRSTGGYTYVKIEGNCTHPKLKVLAYKIRLEKGGDLMIKPASDFYQLRNVKRKREDEDTEEKIEKKARAAIGNKDDLCSSDDSLQGVVDSDSDTPQTPDSVSDAESHEEFREITAWQDPDWWYDYLNEQADNQETDPT